MRSKAMHGEVMTDERLEQLAELFLRMEVREYTGVPFGQFLIDPDHYVEITGKLCLAYRLRSMRRELKRRFAPVRDGNGSCVGN